jgi:hypothetical protein
MDVERIDNRQRAIPRRTSTRCIGLGASQCSYSLRVGSVRTVTPGNPERVVLGSLRAPNADEE